MKTKVFILVLLGLSFLLQSCITPEVTTKNIVRENPKNMLNLEVAVMPFLARELHESEIEDITEEITDKLAQYGNIKKLIIIERKSNYVETLKTWERFNYYQNRIVKKALDDEVLSEWNMYWENYASGKIMNLEILKKIENTLEVNCVFQIGVIELKKVRPVHRKVVAATTAEVKYTLLSTKGNVLIEGSSVATQANAWSGQLTPRPIEAIDAAIDDILENFSFTNNRLGLL